MEDQARLKPSSKAAPTDLPWFNSSFVLSKIKMLASTAIPTDKIKPVIPASVNVTGIVLNNAKEINV